LESDEKIENAKVSFDNSVYSSAIYHAYSSLINSAKALLLSENISTNTQAGIIKQFEENFIDTKKINLGTSFSELVYQIKMHAPTKAFALNYITNAEQFLNEVRVYRELEIEKRRLKRKAG
jgi:sulfite reductase (ferredoxin)